MTIAQCKSKRKRMLLRFGDGRKFGWSVADAIAAEQVKAERQRAAQSKKKSK